MARAGRTLSERCKNFGGLTWSDIQGCSSTCARIAWPLLRSTLRIAGWRGLLPDAVPGPAGLDELVQVEASEGGLFCGVAIGSLSIGLLARAMQVLYDGPIVSGPDLQGASLKGTLEVVKVTQDGPTQPLVVQKNQGGAVFLMERAKRIDFDRVDRECPASTEKEGRNHGSHCGRYGQPHLVVRGCEHRAGAADRPADRPRRAGHASGLRL